VAGGARLLCGGRRDGAFFEPTLLADVPPDARIACEEAFGPVACIEPYDDFEAVLQRVNDSRYGLQAGFFTQHLGRIHQAFERLEIGALIVNDVPTMRVDSMPYGGVKDSGLGREGVASAIEAYTTPRVLVHCHER
jgi:acyl-CoA reductase-like NAD-dependent aldehyde dehydrogenase